MEIYIIKRGIGISASCANSIPKLKKTKDKNFIIVDAAMNNLIRPTLYEAFHNIEIVKFLTRFQPVKIIHWSGITNGEKAHFKLWFLGWKNFKVKHKEYKSDKNRLHFIDQGQELPLGITEWKHTHIVEKKNQSNSFVTLYKLSSYYVETYDFSPKTFASRNSAIK